MKKQRESEKIFYTSFEQRSISIEKKINKLRYFFVVLFILSGFSSYRSGAAPAIYQTIFISTVIYLVNIIIWDIILKYISYKPWIKYANTTIDLTLLFMVKYAFHNDIYNGWGMAIKDPATFDVFFLFIILAGLRLDKIFSIYTGVLSAVLYIVLLLLALNIGGMEATAEPSKMFHPKYIRMNNEVSKISFLVMSSIIIAFLANETRNFLGMLSESESRAHHNLNVMRNILEKTESISTELKKMTGVLKINFETMKNTVATQKEYFTKDTAVLKELVKQSEESNSITNAQLQLIAKISERISKLKNISEEIQNAVDVTYEKTKSSKEATKESMTHLSEANNVVIEMKSQTEKIVNISGVISEIADRTNLLSLNASIEAARAGEHGRGFSVVAMEVQKLADQSINSSKEIHSTINATVKNIEKSSSMLQVTSAKLESVLNISEEGESFMQKLKENIGVQNKLNFAIQGNIKDIIEIAENVCSFTLNQRNSLEAVEERNLLKYEETEESVQISNKLEEISNRLNEISNSLYELVKGRDEIISEERRSQFPNPLVVAQK